MLKSIPQQKTAQRAIVYPAYTTDLISDLHLQKRK